MFSEAELLKAIDELEKAPTTYQDAEKLATFYTIYDHSYKRKEPEVEPIKEVTIDRYNGSEFYRAISGKRAKDVWKVINGVIEMLKVTQPSVYIAVIKRLTNL
jgi:hypothetical protein